MNFYDVFIFSRVSWNEVPARLMLVMKKCDLESELPAYNQHETHYRAFPAATCALLKVGDKHLASWSLLNPFRIKISIWNHKREQRHGVSCVYVRANNEHNIRCKKPNFQFAITTVYCRLPKTKPRILFELLVWGPS